MPTELTYYAFYLHQLSVKYTCPFHYVTWNSEYLQWKCESFRLLRMWPYYTILFFSVLGCMLYFVLIFCIKGSKLETLRDAVYISGFHILPTILMFAVDYMFLSSASPLLQAANWILSEKFIRIPSRPQTTTNMGTWNVLKTIIHEIMRKLAKISICIRIKKN